MTIRVELNPEMERELAEEALARGIALELYAQRLLQEAIASKGKGHARKPGRISGVFGRSCEQSAECSPTANRDLHPRNDLW